MNTKEFRSKVNVDLFQSWNVVEYHYDTRNKCYFKGIFIKDGAVIEVAAPTWERLFELFPSTILIKEENLIVR